MARYQIIGEIGSGGMATIYEATRRCGDLDQVVAIKHILPELRTDESIRARFRQEAEFCMQLAHPNIVRAYDLDADDKKDLIIVMERVDGVSLENLAAQVELTPPVIRLILAHLLRGLAHVHGQGILHRDISPKNILISRNGDVKLADFGLAKRIDSPCTEPGFKGTAAYASPAVIQTGEGDVYSDLYSLAAVGYWMLTKTPPYFHGHLMQIVRRMSLGSIPPLPEATPADLRGLITSLLHYMKERIFHSAEQAEAALMQDTEPMASPEELGTLVRQAMNQDLPADEQPDMERAETRQVKQAASRHPERADVPHRAHTWQYKQLLLITAIWLGAISTVALWMQCGSTRPGPS
ncbi:MAG: serine/threonine protein kinase, partial [Nitrospira sp.]|nr:serine/threonine protein kinase [Nitrospira sp.]